MLKGIAVSPGVVVARAYCVDDTLIRREPRAIDAANVTAEIARFDDAVKAAAAELDAIVAGVSQQLGEAEAAIFRGHRLLVRDPALASKVKSDIFHKKIEARTALHDALREYAELFEQIKDPYLQERLADLRDVVGRILSQLTVGEVSCVNTQADEPIILVAQEILPSQALMLNKLKVAGLITEQGGRTGHAAILARALGIPYVSGLSGIRHQLATGELLALDGREGHVHLRPDPEVESFFRKLQREYGTLRQRLVENRDQAAVTLDGTAVELLANVNGLADASLAVGAGAVGVGLYRTEYLFLTNASVPDEEEQLAAYREVVESAPQRRVTIRTLDLGGDKVVPYFPHARETNPFMGWRSIRLTTTYPEFFQTQLRAILRASVHGRVSLMFPMVSTLEEILALKKLIRRTKESLRQQGILFDEQMPVGAMLEVPAAALSLEAILNEVDFISIGSNDLTQYVMAADRDNPKVAHLCEPFNPPVLRLLRHIIRTCVRRAKPVTLCGEMAGRPRFLLPLLGMGLRRFSMSPAFIPTIKELVRSSTLDQARKIARKTGRLTTFRQVRNYLNRVTTRICPNIAPLETRK